MSALIPLGLELVFTNLTNKGDLAMIRMLWNISCPSIKMAEIYKTTSCKKTLYDNWLGSAKQELAELTSISNIEALCQRIHAKLGGTHSYETVSFEIIRKVADMVLMKIIHTRACEANMTDVKMWATAELKRMGL